MTGLDRLASRGSHALFWLVLGAEDSAQGELTQLSEAERGELLRNADRLVWLLQGQQ